MKVLKRVSYIQTQNGWQTYLLTSNFHPIRYKFISSKEELESVIARCQQQGWKITEATKLVQALTHYRGRALRHFNRH
ncbi:MAG: hypothetical protein ACRDEA_21735 [Microcystaceae cyanobacterium]